MFTGTPYQNVLHNGPRPGSFIESAFVLVGRRRASTQPPFFGFDYFVLTDRRDFCHNAHEENEQTARNETRWYRLRPAGAGFLRKYFASRWRGRDKSGKAKTMKEN